MPIVEPAELLGHITTEDGRKIPHYKVKTETTLTNVDTGAEYESEAAAQADVDDPGTSTTVEKIRRDVKVFYMTLMNLNMYLVNLKKILKIFYIKNFKEMYLLQYLNLGLIF